MRVLILILLVVAVGLSAQTIVHQGNAFVFAWDVSPDLTDGSAFPPNDGVFHEVYRTSLATIDTPVADPQDPTMHEFLGIADGTTFIVACATPGIMALGVRTVLNIPDVPDHQYSAIAWSTTEPIPFVALCDLIPSQPGMLTITVTIIGP